MWEVKTFCSPPRAKVNGSYDHIVDDVSDGAAHVLCLMPPLVHPPTYVRAYLFPYSDIKYTLCPALSPTPILLLVTNSTSAHRPYGFAHTTKSPRLTLFHSLIRISLRRTLAPNYRKSLSFPCAMPPHLRASGHCRRTGNGSKTL